MTEQQEQEIKKLIYNPSAVYQWKVSDEFQFTGIELQALNDYLTNFVTSNLDVPSILKVAAAKRIVQDIIARNVETGKIVEADPENIPQPQI